MNKVLTIPALQLIINFYSTMQMRLAGNRVANNVPGMHRHHPFWVYSSLFALSLSVVACGGGDGALEELPKDPPTEIKLVASKGFTSPRDGVASPDGSMFYFTAMTLDDEPKAAIFSVPSKGGDVDLVSAGKPLESPTGLLMSCDGSLLYIADMSLDDELDGAIYSLQIDSSELSVLVSDGIAVPSGLAMDPDCTSIHVTGINQAGEPAVFAVPAEGGTATETYAGGMLVSPSGIHVDTDNVAWVMDQLAVGDDGPGVLFAITPLGEVEEVISGLRMGAPGGVSLAAGGVTAVIPELDEFGDARLTSINTVTGEQTELPAPQMVSPAGIRTAREAGIFVVVDNEGAIFSAR